MQPEQTKPLNMRCIIIGAGVSGILMAIKLKKELGDNVDFWIFEKNEGLGGTWFENRYPGCACDVPSHIYQYTFCPNPYWSSFYASSTEINSYLRAVSYHYGITQYISFNSAVNNAVWDEQASTWTVSVDDQGDFQCEILFNASGILNNIQYPNIKNLNTWKGPLLHTAAWDNELDLDGRRVAIIGGGASAMQVLPAIQGRVKRVDVYIRTPSWITPSVGETEKWKRSHVFTPEEQQRFRDDPAYSLRTRKAMEEGFNQMFKAFFKDSDEQRSIRSALEQNMRELIPDQELQSKLIPKFEVGCKRVSPGEPFLRTLQEQNVDVIFSPVDEATPEGLIAGGKLRKVDVVIAASGFDTSFRPRFPIIGRGGVNLRDLWQTEPVSYCGLAVAGFPNYLIFLGPNTPISNGSLMGTLEATADYFIRLIKKAREGKARSFEIRDDVQADFDAHTQESMEQMVWTGNCRSWYKGDDGKIRALWPGSSLHYREVLESNRWEDFSWQYKGNRFAYWGKGISKVEGIGTGKPGDLAYYFEQHEPLPFESYELSAKAGVVNQNVPAAFRPKASNDHDSTTETSSGESTPTSI